MSFTNSPQGKLAREWDRVFVEKDLDALSKCLHKSFHQATYPGSLSQPVRNKEEFLAFIAKLFPLWAETKSTVHSVIEAPGKAISHYLFEAKTTNGTWTTREGISILHFGANEDGSLKIVKSEEFLDSNSFSDTTRAFAAAQA